MHTFDRFVPLRSLALSAALAGALLLGACGGEAEQQSTPEVSAPAQPEEAEMAMEEMADDLAARLDAVLASTEDELARLEETVPELAMDAQARLAAEIETLSAQLDQLRQLEEQWSAAGAEQRQVLEDRVGELIDEVERTLERTDELLYAQEQE